MVRAVLINFSIYVVKPRASGEIACSSAKEDHPNCKDILQPVEDLV